MTLVGNVPRQRTVVLEMLGLVPGQIGGMETYARNLARALPALDSRYRYLAVVGTEAQGLFQDGGGPIGVWVADPARPAWARRVRPLRTLLQSAALARQLRRWAPDVVHCTLTFPKPAWGTRNMVITIHDLNFELLPGCWNPLDRRIMSLSCRLATRMAVALVTISDFSKRTLIQTYGVSADRVHVTPHGVRADLFAPAADAGATAALRRDLDLPPEVLFFPANTWPHKNHARLLEALAALRETDGLRPCLVLTGSVKHGHRGVMDAVRRLGLRDQVRWLGYVDQRRLVALYRAATALVFPSLHEGFGLPILEAMACGCPVACSRTTAAGETAGDAALTFDPTDVSEIAHALRALLQSEELRRDLTRRGLRRADQFTWERSARATLRVYDEVVSHVPIPGR
ncbi:MAG: glycosyltransferase family 4 protein [Candidatus Rokubacteria bacterium]|nr:glycosyltransferase family 4 protein [Candidatus Rokubacteria bacterium]